MAVMKFMNTTTIQKAFDYLEGDVDSNDKVRCHKPKPFHNDRESLEKIDQLAKDLGIKNTHSSLTISFDENDIKVPSANASQEEVEDFYKKYESFIQKEINNFRDQWLPGMKEGENFADYWNIHIDKGRLELNCVFVKMELTTGKQFNPFQPGQLNIDMRDHYIDLLNDRNGFDRKISNPFAIHHNDIELKEFGNETEFTLNQKNVIKPKKDDIQNYLSKQIVDNKINNRQELIQELQKYGEVKFLDKENLPPDPKTGKHNYDYISFIPEGFDKAIRLDGPAFKKDVDFNELREEFHQHHKKDEKTNEYKLVNLELTDKEREDKKKKLETHRDYELKKNMKLMSKPKATNKNKNRVYLSKDQKKNKNSKKLQELKRKKDDIKKPNSMGVGKDGKQDKKPEPPPTQPVEDKVAVIIQETIKEREIKNKEDDIKMKEDDKKQVTNKPTEGKGNKPKEDSSSNKPQSHDDFMKSMENPGTNANELNSQVTSIDSRINSISSNIANATSELSSLESSPVPNVLSAIVSRQAKIDELKKRIAQLEQERQALIAKRNDLGDLLNQALVAEKYANGTYKASKPTINDTRKDEK